MTNLISLSTLAWASILGSHNANTAPSFIPISKADTTLTAKKEDTDPWKLSGYVALGQETSNGAKQFVSNVPRSVFNISAAGNGDVGVTLASTPKKGFGGTINVTGGDAADVVSSFGTDGLYNGNRKWFDVTQLFAQYAGDNYAIYAGKFVTLAGAEVIAAPANANYTRGILFGYAIPFTHTGIRATVNASSTVALTAGINNGWDDLVDTNKSKTFEGQIAWNPNSAFSFAATGYAGKERVAGLISEGNEGNRSVIDLLATYNFSPTTSLTLNYDYGQQDSAKGFTLDGNDRAKWSGIAAYLHHSFTDKFGATVRFEHFDDTDGFRTGLIQKWEEATLTLAYTPDAAHEYRVEGRVDSSNINAFFSTDYTSTKKSVTTLAGQAIWKF